MTSKNIFFESIYTREFINKRISFIIENDIDNSDNIGIIKNPIWINNFNNNIQKENLDGISIITNPLMIYYFDNDIQKENFINIINKNIYELVNYIEILVNGIKIDCIFDKNDFFVFNTILKFEIIKKKNTIYVPIPFRSMLSNFGIAIKDLKNLNFQVVFSSNEIFKNIKDIKIQITSKNYDLKNEYINSTNEQKIILNNNLKYYYDKKKKIEYITIFNRFYYNYPICGIFNRFNYNYPICGINTFSFDYNILTTDLNFYFLDKDNNICKNKTFNKVKIIINSEIIEKDYDIIDDNINYPKGVYNISFGDSYIKIMNLTIEFTDLDKLNIYNNIKDVVVVFNVKNTLSYNNSLLINFT